MKVPNIIELGCHEVEVLFDDAQEDKGWRGTYSNRTHKILLNPGIHPQHLRVTFLHELVHFICDVGDMSPSEQDISRLAEGLGDILFRCFGLEFDFSGIEVLVRKYKERTSDGDSSKES